MNLIIYQVDAFTDSVFSGNPAAICPLKNWLPDNVMQNIALENNLSETAFFVKNENTYHIRWFTPQSEIDLCGHATLASAYVIFEYLEKNIDQVVFQSKSGELIVEKKNELLEMDFPSEPPLESDPLKDLPIALGAEPISYYKGSFMMVLFEDEETVKNLNPDFLKLKGIDFKGFIATAPGDNVDFVSRVFAPKVGINEDPVTGSAHTVLIPFWSKRLKKSKLKAKQISKRGGELTCELNGTRVKIAGKAALYMVGEIFI